MKNVAIVTGASRGLGEVIAEVLAARGYDLVIGARDRAALDAVRTRLAAHGSNVIPVDGDIVDPTTRQRLIESARILGGLDLLINNASELGPIGPLMEFDVTRLGRLMPVNAGAPTVLMQMAVPLLSERRGLIVNITSDAAVAAYPGWGPYGASKAALELISRTLASELASEGVSVVLVDPGDMRTRMHQDAYKGQDISDRPLPGVTTPFWHWLLDQRPEDLRGQRLIAQAEDPRWYRRAS
jgi:NAD(P)-dependent dehydrogenase (short-subunit alcohol dehydrogenase family)